MIFVDSESGEEITKVDENELQKINSEINRQEAIYTNEKDNVTNFSNQINVLEQEYGNLQSQYQVLSGEIEDLQSEYSIIETECNTLEKEITLAEQKGNAETKEIKGGIKKEDLSSEEQKMFDKFDKDGNGILDADEVAGIRNASGKDEKLSTKEAKKLGKSIGVDKKDALKVKSFVTALNKSGSEIVSSTVEVKDGVKIINTEKKDGTKSQTNYNITQGGKAQKANENFLDKDGNSVETNYNEKGQKTNTVSVDKKTNVKLSTEFDEEGNVTAAIEVDGKTEKTYGQGGKIEGRELTVTENKGTAAEVVTIYAYNENNEKASEITVGGNVKTERYFNEGQTVEIIRVDGKTKSTTLIAEDGSKKEAKFEDNNLITTTYNAEGVRVLEEKNEITTEGKTVKITNTQYSENGNKLEETIINEDGTTHNVTYDGKGNTNIIIQNNESLEKLYKKFGKDGQSLNAFKAEIEKLNNFDFEKNVLQVGQGFKVPGEIAADDSSIKDRKTKEASINSYTKATNGLLEKQMNEEWFNNGFTDSNGTLTSFSTDEQCKTIPTQSHKNGESIAKQVLKEQGIENPTADQVNNTRRQLELLNFGFSNNKSLLELKEIKVPKSKTEMANFVATEKATANKAIADEKSAVIQDNAINLMQTNLIAAADMFQAHENSAGWASDVANGVSYLWNNPAGEVIGVNTGNTAGQVRKDIAAQQELIDALKKAPDHKTFVKIFEKETGIPYNEVSHQYLQTYVNEVQANKKTFDQNTYNQLYKNAFGNNMMERVQKYSERQNMGADWVKIAAAAVATTAITVATGGVAGMAIGGIVNASIGLSDKLSNNVHDENLNDVLLDFALGTITLPGLGAGTKVATNTAKGVSERKVTYKIS